MDSGYIWIENIPILKSDSGWQGNRIPCLIIPSDYVQNYSDKELSDFVFLHFQIDDHSIQRDGPFVWINYQRDLQ